MSTTEAYIAHFVTPSYGPEVGDPPARQWRKIARVWRSLLDANGYNGNHEVPQIAKDTPRNYVTAHVGWYVNVVTHEVAANLPADNSAAAQREEIKGIIRQEYYRFNRVRFRSVDGANRPISDTIDKRAQFLLAALPLNDSDTALDLIKTEARVPLDDFALYARLTSGTGNWRTAFDGGSFYAFVKGTINDSTDLPSATAGVTAPSSAQVDGVKLEEELA